MHMKTTEISNKCIYLRDPFTDGKNRTKFEKLNQKTKKLKKINC